MDRLRGLRGGTLLFYYMFTLCAAVYGPVSYTHLDVYKRQT